MRPWDTPSRHHLPSGRLAVHAYSAYGWAAWEKTWHETKAGELSGFFDEIAAEVERAAPRIVAMYEETERRHEEQKRKWDAEQREARRKEAARRRQEVEKKRLAHVDRTMDRWRMARDLREYVWGVHALVADAELRITEGGPLDQELKWALGHAERIDPLRRIREEIAKAKARESGEAHSGAPGSAADREDDDADEPWPKDAEPVDEARFYYGSGDSDNEEPEDGDDSRDD